MEIKAEINKPITGQQRYDFIMEHSNGYEIRETSEALQAWGYTEEELAQQERLRLDSLTLTPSDVERALFKAKGWDFEDLKTYLRAQGYTELQVKAISIELRANDFYRGATLGETRIVDAIGLLLGYTSADMDYLFEHKELPTPEPESEPTEEPTEEPTDEPTEEPEE